ncbi:MAG: hypothetical protein GX605_13035 [Chloroflexi bacterium]|nr:hypothetical protein [Chloroflexota bacterium]
MTFSTRSPHTMLPGCGAWPWLAWGYVVLVVGWAALYLLFHERWWWLALLNTFAVYLFAPLPLLALLAAWTRRPSLWLGVAVVAALGLVFFGRHLLPPPVSASAAGPSLTVLTANVLATHDETAPVLAALRASGADLIALQELNPTLAAALQRELADEYPYQFLAPKANFDGMGILSRYPLEPLHEEMGDWWVGDPQVVELDLDAFPVTVLNFHAIPPGDLLHPATRDAARARQAGQIVALSQRRPGPYLALGDLNASERSGAYRLIAGSLTDVWREAGWGLGHTFPGGVTPGGSRPRLGGVYVPQWLIRIDYIFASPHWQPLRASIGPWDGLSDHRPVRAVLGLHASLNEQ